MKFNLIKLLKTGLISSILSCSFSAQAQEIKGAYGDLTMGTYLFISHIPYDAVVMSGARLGYRWDRASLAASYMAGQQHDEKGNLGLTHHACVEASVFLKPGNIQPYLLFSTGFLEFKSFSRDKYGIANQVGLGAQFQITERISALLEPRYMNMAQMKLGGVHQLVVAWGLRARF